MLILVKRSFPWFPVVLAAGWLLMMGLAVRDLAWFAAAGPSFDDGTTTASTPQTPKRRLAKATPAAAVVETPNAAPPCTAAAIAPAARLAR